MLRTASLAEADCCWYEVRYYFDTFTWVEKWNGKFNSRDSAFHEISLRKLWIHYQRKMQSIMSLLQREFVCAHVSILMCVTHNILIYNAHTRTHTYTTRMHTHTHYLCELSFADVWSLIASWLWIHLQRANCLISKVPNRFDSCSHLFLWRIQCPQNLASSP